MARDRGSLLKTVALLLLTPLAYPLGLLYGWWQRRETIVGMLRLGGRALYARSPAKRAWLRTALVGGGVVVLWYSVPWVWSHLPTLPSAGPSPGSALAENPVIRHGMPFDDLARSMMNIIAPLAGMLGVLGITISLFAGRIAFLPGLIGLVIAVTGPLLLGLMR